jgi:hypothetical protein
MSLIQTAQNVDLSNANVTHVSGNQYNAQCINVYNQNRALNVRKFLVEMLSRLTSSKGAEDRIRPHSATSRPQVRLIGQ